MFCNAMVPLQDGRVLIDSGTIQYDPFYGERQVAVFEPASNTFTNVQSMAHGRWYPTLVTLGDGRVMTFSGLNETGGTNTAVEFYTPGSGWSQQYPASWTPDLYPRLHLLPSGKVFYAGAQTTSKLFDPATTSWNINVASTNYSGNRTYGTSVLLPLTPANGYDPKVIIMGGHSPATNTTEIIDMGAVTPVWQPGPNMSAGRIEMNAVILPDGRVLAVGGSVNDEDVGTASLAADLLGPDPNNPGKYVFSSAGANAYPRLYHSVALLLPDATVWLAGGNPSRGSYVQQMEIYQPPYLFTPTGTLATRPSISSSPSSISYGNAFTVQTPDAASITRAVLVRNGAVTHAFGMDQRAVEMSFTVGNGFLSVTTPPNGNVAPPGQYMLFLLNGAGTPSMAAFTQVATQPDFAVTAAPSSRSVVPSTGTTYSVSVSPSGGFNGSVILSASGLPSGASASFSPSAIAGSGSSNLSISTSSGTPAGTYPVTITATSGSLVHTAQVTLFVGDFSVTASPSSQTASGNTKLTYTVTVTAVGSFSGSINFSISGLPNRVTASFSPSSVVSSGTTKLTLSVKPRAPTGTFPLTISATGGGANHATTVSLVIR